MRRANQQIASALFSTVGGASSATQQYPAATLTTEALRMSSRSKSSSSNGREQRGGGERDDYRRSGSNNSHSRRHHRDDDRSRRGGNNRHSSSRFNSNNSRDGQGRRAGSNRPNDSNKHRNNSHGGGDGSSAMDEATAAALAMLMSNGGNLAPSAAAAAAVEMATGGAQHKKTNRPPPAKARAEAEKRGQTSAAPPPAAYPTISVQQTQIGGFSLPTISFGGGAAPAALTAPSKVPNSAAAADIDEDLLFFDASTPCSSSTTGTDANAQEQSHVIDPTPTPTPADIASKPLRALGKEVRRVLKEADAATATATSQPGDNATVGTTKAKAKGKASKSANGSALTNTVAAPPVAEGSALAPLYREGIVKLSPATLASNLSTALETLLPRCPSAVAAAVEEPSAGALVLQSAAVATATTTVLLSQLTRKAEASSSELGAQLQEVIATGGSGSEADVLSGNAISNGSGASSALTDPSATNAVIVPAATATAAALALSPDQIAEILPANIHSLLSKGATAEAIGASLTAAAKDGAALVEAALVAGPQFTEEVLQRQLLTMFTALQEKLMGFEEEVAAEANDDANSASASDADHDDMTSLAIAANEKRTKKAAMDSSAAALAGRLGVVPPHHPLHDVLRWHMTRIGAMLQVAHTLITFRNRPLTAASLNNAAVCHRADEMLAQQQQQSSSEADSTSTPATTKMKKTICGQSFSPLDKSHAARAYRLRRRRTMADVEARVQMLRAKGRLLDGEFLRDVAALVELNSLMAASPSSPSSSGMGGGDVSEEEAALARATILRNLLTATTTPNDEGANNATSSDAPPPSASARLNLHKLFAANPLLGSVLSEAYLPLYAHLRQELVVRYEPYAKELRRLEADVEADRREAQRLRAAALPIQGKDNSGRPQQQLIENADDAEAASDASSEASDMDVESEGDGEDAALGIVAEMDAKIRGSGGDGDAPAPAADDGDALVSSPTTAVGNSVDNQRSNANTTTAVIDAAAGALAAVVSGPSSSAADRTQSILRTLSNAAATVGPMTIVAAPGKALSSAAAAAQQPPMPIAARVLLQAVSQQQRAVASDVANAAHTALALGNALSSMVAVAVWKRSEVVRDIRRDGGGDDEDSSSLLVPRTELATSFKATQLLSRPDEVQLPSSFRTAYPVAAVDPLLVIADGVRFTGLSDRLIGEVVERHVEAAAESSEKEGGDVVGIDVDQIKSSLRQLNLPEVYHRLMNRAADFNTSLEDNKKLLAKLYTHAKLLSQNFGGSSSSSVAFNGTSAMSAIDPRVVHRWLQQQIKAHEKAEAEMLRLTRSSSAGSSGGSASSTASDVSPEVAKRIASSSLLHSLSPEEAKHLAIVIGASIATVRGSASIGGDGYNSGGLTEAHTMLHIEASHRTALAIVNPLLARQLLSEAGSLMAVVQSAQMQREYAVAMAEFHQQQHDDKSLGRRADEDMDGDHDEYDDYLPRERDADGNPKSDDGRGNLPPSPPPPPSPPRVTTTSFSSFGEVRLLVESLRFTNATAQSTVSTAVTSLAVAWLSAHAAGKNGAPDEALIQMAELASIQQQQQSQQQHIRGDDGAVATTITAPSSSPLDAASSAKVTLLRPLSLKELRALFQQLADPQWVESPLLHNMTTATSSGGASSASSSSSSSIADIICAVSHKVAWRQVYKHTGMLARLKRAGREAERSLKRLRANFDKVKASHSSSSSTSSDGSNSSGGALDHHQQTALSLTSRGDHSAAAARSIGRAYAMLKAQEEKVRQLEGKVRGLKAHITNTCRALLGLYLDGLSVGQPQYLELRASSLRGSLVRGGAVSGGGVGNLVSGKHLGDGDLMESSSAADFSFAPADSVSLYTDWNRRQRRLSIGLQRMLFVPPLKSSATAVATDSTNRTDSVFSTPLVDESRRANTLKDAVTLAVGEIASFLVTSLRFAQRPANPDDGKHVTLEVRLARYLLAHGDYTTLNAASVAIGVLERAQGQPFPLAATSDYLSAKRTSASLAPLLPPDHAVSHMALAAVEMQQQQQLALSASGVAAMDEAPKQIGGGNGAAEEKAVAALPAATALAASASGIVDPLAALATNPSGRAATVRPVHDVILQLFEQANPHDSLRRNKNQTAGDDVPDAKSPRVGAILSALAMCDPKAAAQAHATADRAMESLRYTARGALKKQKRAAEAAERGEAGAAEDIQNAAAIVANTRAAARHIQTVLVPSLPSMIPLKVQAWMVQELARVATVSSAQPDQLAKIMRNVVSTFDVSVLDPMTMSDVFHSFKPNVSRLQTQSALLNLESMAILEERAAKYINYRRAQLYNDGDGNGKALSVDDAADAHHLSIDLYRFPLIKEDMAQIVRKNVRKNADTIAVAAIPTNVASAASLVGNDSLFLDNEDGSLPDAMRSFAEGSLAASASASALATTDPSALSVRNVRQIIPIMRASHNMTSKLFAHVSRYVTGAVCISNPALAAAVAQAESIGDPMAAEQAMNRMPPMVLATHVFITDAELFARHYRATSRFRVGSGRAADHHLANPLTAPSASLPTRNERDGALFMNYFTMSEDGRRLLPRSEETFFFGGNTSQQTLFDVLSAFTTMASEYTSTASTDAATFEQRLKQAARADSKYRGSTFESVLWPTIRSHVLGEGSVTVAPLVMKPSSPNDATSPNGHLQEGEMDEDGNPIHAFRAYATAAPPPLPKHPITLSLREITALFGAFSYIDISDTTVLSALVRRLQRMWRAAVEVAKAEASSATAGGGGASASNSASADLEGGFNIADDNAVGGEHSNGATDGRQKALLLPHKTLIAWAHTLDAPTAVAVLGSLLDGATDATFIRLLSPALVTRISQLAYAAEEASHGHKQQQRRRANGSDAAVAPYTPSAVAPVIELLYPSDVLHLMPTLITLMRHHEKIYGELKYDNTHSNATSHGDAAAMVESPALASAKAAASHGMLGIAAALAPSLPSDRVAAILKNLHSLYEGSRQALFIMYGAVTITPVERLRRDEAIKAKMKALSGSDSTANSGETALTASADGSDDAALMMAAAGEDEDLPVPSVPTSYYIRLVTRLLHSDLRDVEVADVCFKMITRTGHILQQLKGKDFTAVMHAALVFRGSVEDNLTPEGMAALAKIEREGQRRRDHQTSSPSAAQQQQNDNSVGEGGVVDSDAQTTRIIAEAKLRRRTLFKPLVDHLWHHGNRSGLERADKALLLRWMHSKFGFVDSEIVLQLGMDANTEVHRMPVHSSVVASAPAEAAVSPTAPSSTAGASSQSPKMQNGMAVASASAVGVGQRSASAVNEDVNAHMNADDMFLGDDAEDSPTAVDDAASRALDAEEASAVAIGYSMAKEEAKGGVGSSSSSSQQSPPPPSSASAQMGAEDLWDDLMMLEDDNQ